MRIPKKDKPAVTPAKGKGKAYGKQRAATKGKISYKGDGKRKAPVKSKGKPSKGKAAKGRPAKGKPAKGRPAKGRPAKGRPARGRPAKGKPSRVIRGGRQGKKNKLVKRVRLTKKKRRQKFKELVQCDFATAFPDYIAAMEDVFYTYVNPLGVQFDLERILINLFGKLECLEAERKPPSRKPKQKQISHSSLDECTYVESFPVPGRSKRKAVLLPELTFLKFQPRRYILSEGGEETLDDFQAGFWEFVEVHSGDFKEDDIKSIEDSIKEDESGVFYEVPPLGGYPSKEVNNQSRNVQDQGEIKENGVKLVNGTGGGYVNGIGGGCMNGAGGYVNDTGGGCMNGAGGYVNDTGGGCMNGAGGYVNGTGGGITNGQNVKYCDEPLGPLAQRLSACFMEEPPDIVSRLRSYKNKEPPIPSMIFPPANPEFVTCFNLPPTFESAEELDDRIRKKLFNLGILDSLEPEEPEDKVLKKLETLQSKLKAVCAQTLPMKKRIVEMARKEMPVQSYFREVEKAENKLITEYRKAARWRTFYPEVYEDDPKVMAYKREHDLLESRRNSTVMKFLLDYQDVVQRSDNRTETDD